MRGHGILIVTLVFGVIASIASTPNVECDSDTQCSDKCVDGVCSDEGDEGEGEGEGEGELEPLACGDLEDAQCIARGQLCNEGSGLCAGADLTDTCGSDWSRDSGGPVVWRVLQDQIDGDTGTDCSQVLLFDALVDAPNGFNNNGDSWMIGSDGHEAFHFRDDTHEPFSEKVDEFNEDTWLVRQYACEDDDTWIGVGYVDADGNRSNVWCF